MKAKEWASRLAKADAQEEVYQSFALETINLVLERTAKSNVLSRGAALDGAMREQGQKWAAISRLSQSNSLLNFGEVMESFAPELDRQYKEYLLRKKNKQEGRSDLSVENDQAPLPAKPKVDLPKGLDGRRIADTLEEYPVKDLLWQQDVPSDFGGRCGAGSGVMPTHFWSTNSPDGSG